MIEKRTVVERIIDNVRMLHMITTTGCQLLLPAKEPLRITKVLWCRHRSSSPPRDEVNVYLTSTNDEAEWIDAPPSRNLICGA